jgi:hypothetical protein
MQKRKLIVAFAVGLAVTGVSTAAAPADQLLACAGMADPTARLACFDKLAAPLARPTAPARAPAPAAPTPAATAPPAIAPPPSFGQEQVTRERRPESKEEAPAMHARLTSQKPAGGGYFNLYLDNGQVWRHEDQMLGQYLKDGDAITIEKGALGSYRLSRDAGKSRNWIRVSRLR